MTATCLVLVILFAASTFSLDIGLNITTNTGALVGTAEYYNGSTYYSFKGVPYAEAPVGDLRFRPPVGKSPWTGVLNATEFGADCPQTGSRYPNQSEDCLFLNIFVPQTVSEETLPVYIYVHGGEFVSGSGGSYMNAPQLLMQTSGIILVTVNYRLGALGFLNLQIPEASGNMAIKDVLMALKWVNTNINFFGGNPEKITIGGQSSGATIAHYLTLTSKANNLFRGLILESGSVLIYRHQTQDPLAVAFDLAAALNITTNSTETLLSELKNTSPTDLVNAIAIMGANDTRKGLRNYSPFVPSVEIEYDDAIIIKPPIELINEGLIQNVPVLAGTNAQEGLVLRSTVRQNLTLIELLNEDNQRLIPTDLTYETNSEESIDLASDIKEFYFNDENVTADDSYLKFITDADYIHGIDYWVRIHKAKANSSSLYYYYFTFQGELNWSRLVYNLTDPGAAHTDEIGYIFYTNATAEILPEINATTSRMLNNIQNIIVNFVTYLDPTPADSNLNFTWDESVYPEMNYLDLSSEPQMMPTAFIRNRTLFWENIYNDFYSTTT